MTDLVRKVLEIAATQVGVREHGRNTGPEIVGYCRDIGWPERGIHPANGPDPWCAIFVSAMFKRAAAELGVLMPFRPTAGVFTLDVKAPPWARSGKPAPGAIFILNGHKHTGLVTGVPSIGDTVETIEGNTSPAGSPDGDGVYARTRHRSEILCFLDFSQPRP